MVEENKPGIQDAQKTEVEKTPAAQTENKIKESSLKELRFVLGFSSVMTSFSAAVFLALLGNKAASEVTKEHWLQWYLGSTFFLEIVTLGLVVWVLCAANRRNLSQYIEYREILDNTHSEYNKRLETVLSKIIDVDAKHSLNIRYLPATDARKSEAAQDLYKECKKYIDTAQHYIMGVNSYVEMCDEAKDDSCKKERDEYFNAILKKIGKVKYERILQVNCASDELDRGEKISELTKSMAESYCAHFQAIIKIRESRETDNLVGLHWDVAMYPTSYVVIDGKYLIWQLNEHIPSEASDKQANNLRMRGVFLIHDPDGRIISHFEGWFYQLQNTRQRRVEQKELLCRKEANGQTQ